MVENREIRFEQDIETSLTQLGGWENESFQDSHYDASVGIDLDKLIAFIEKTQPKQWERYLTIYQSDSKRKLMKRLMKRSMPMECCIFFGMVSGIAV